MFGGLPARFQILLDEFNRKRIGKVRGHLRTGRIAQDLDQTAVRECPHVQTIGGGANGGFTAAASLGLTRSKLGEPSREARWHRSDRLRVERDFLRDTGNKGI